MQPRDHICGILVKNMVTFYPCSKSLPKAKLKHFGLIMLSEDISKQSSVDCVMWLLVASLIQIYNEQEQIKQGKTQNVQLEENRGTRKYKHIKDRPDAKQNKQSGDLRA